MTNLEIFAKAELTRIGAFDKAGMYGGMLGDAVMKMVKVFSDEGHSGMGASLAIQLFERVARFEPLSPLTGDDDEWAEIYPGAFQNRRCSRVFKDETGVYDSGGRIFREPDGACFQSSGSRVSVSFPYTPKVEYVDIPARV